MYHTELNVQTETVSCVTHWLDVKWFSKRLHSSASLGVNFVGVWYECRPLDSFCTQLYAIRNGEGELL